LIVLFLPLIDHVLYIFFYKPVELTSQRVKYFISQKQYKQSILLLFETRNERKDLVFHTLSFMLVFAALAFWFMSSSGSLFGRGLVLGFWLHLSYFVLKKYFNMEFILNNKKNTLLLIISMFLLLFYLGFL